jgi:hypothetical protein
VLFLPEAHPVSVGTTAQIVFDYTPFPSLQSSQEQQINTFKANDYIEYTTAM